MSNDTFSKEELKEVTENKLLTKEQVEKMNRILNFENSDSLIEVPNGTEFLEELKKEVKRQKAIKLAESLNLNITDKHEVQEEDFVDTEDFLADEFEITEE